MSKHKDLYWQGARKETAKHFLGFHEGKWISGGVEGARDWKPDEFQRAVRNLKLLWTREYYREMFQLVIEKGSRVWFDLGDSMVKRKSTLVHASGLAGDLP